VVYLQFALTFVVSALLTALVLLISTVGAGFFFLVKGWFVKNVSIVCAVTFIVVGYICAHTAGSFGLAGVLGACAGTAALGVLIGRSYQRDNGRM
jgi:hypothetical protein